MISISSAAAAFKKALIPENYSLINAKHIGKLGKMLYFGGGGEGAKISPLFCTHTYIHYYYYVFFIAIKNTITK